MSSPKSSLRPEILNPLFVKTTALKGIGPRLGKLVEKLVGEKIVDLLWHLPSGLIDRRFSPKVGDAPPNDVVTLTVEVLAHSPPPPGNRRVPYRVTCGDDTGRIVLVFFHAKGDYLEDALPIGERRVISGKVELFDGRRQMTHPDHIVELKDIASVQRVEPVYPLTAGLSGKVLDRAVKAALERAPKLPDWLDPAFKKQRQWPDWHEALTTAHNPTSEAELSPLTLSRSRLAYDEMLSNQLALSLVRLKARKRRGRELKGDGKLRAKVIAGLPYKLTGAQSRTLAEIEADMSSENRMLRLLQGDVGSGKTLVALMSMLIAVEAGAQAAMMAPTELLAHQHFENLKPLAALAGVRLEILTGRVKGAVRTEIMEGLANGSIHMVVGTHALVQKDVEFADLAFAVIDEQHRFGVAQRLELAEKGRGTDMLVMTATPIPRTLALTAYGDMDVSKLDEKPPGRKPVDTRTISLERLDETIAGIGRAIQKGAKVYWVCPLIEESEVTDLAAAEDRYATLKARLGNTVGLIHGRMKPNERDVVMEAFASKDGPGKDSSGPKILVATTVIEVGVDVPDATIMVIEHAERFGLSQLHQLRGRVGRGGKEGTCLLLFAPPLGETAKARLNILRQTEDGFLIAEEDLRLRGSGEMLGTRQSGMPEFRMADLSVHGELVAIARDDAQLIISRDAELKTPRGEALRTMLYLFEQDEAIKTLRSG
ncbi:MAG: ATP-dependent DNA helicase RecG [Rhodospirillaceae bacterium]|nr:ATP-dependent DNA helicase RecG [Rhodospirillaceae bacterium]